MKIKVDDRNRDIDILRFKLDSVDINIGAPTYDVKYLNRITSDFPNQCTIKFKDGIELVEFINVLNRTRDECVKLLGKWERME